MKTENLKFKICNFQSSILLLYLFTSLPFCLLTFLMQYSCFAQEIKLTAWVDKQVITTEETLLFSITVAGAQDTNQPQLPQLEGLALAFGPSISDETQIANNNVSISRTFTYVLTPKAPGKYIIGPVKLDYKNKTYTTEPVQIEVVSSTETSKRDKEIDLEKSIFVEISTDKKEAYTYEQITLTFKLYCQRGLPVDNLQYIPPATKNFLLEKLGRQQEYEDVRNDVVYRVVELRTALFPVAAGELLVPPATIKCNLLLRSRQRNQSYDPFFDDFFGTTRRKFPVERQTEPITLTIKPLPEKGKPSDFNGAVGSYGIEVSSRSTNVKVGDPITLTIRVSGEGYVHAIGEPSLSNTEGFKVYPAESRADITERNTPDLIRGWKEFSKVIEPIKTGIKETPTVHLSFFDPGEAQYKTIARGPIPITVEPAEDGVPIQLTFVEDGKPKEQARVLKKDILPLMTNLSELTNQGDLLYKNPILLGFLTLPLVSIIASVIIQQRTERFKTDLSYARKKRAFARAKMQLMAADHLTTQTELYSTISKALCEYIADKLNVPVASITSHDIPVKLEQYDLSPEIIGELTHCLDTCDRGRFSPETSSGEKRPEHELQEVLKSAERLIKHLEKKIKGKEVKRLRGEKDKTSLSLNLLAFLPLNLLAFLPLSKDKAIELFTRANEAYETATKLLSEKNNPSQADALEGFIRASQLYEQILASGFKNGQIYYNLGNAYYRQGKIGYTILNYRRAQKLTPRNEDLKANLKLVKAELKDREKRKDVPRVIQTILFWYFMLNVNEATVLAVSFYFIFSASTLLVIFFRTFWLKKLCIAFGVCLVLATASLVIKICPHRGEEGVIIAETCKLRYGPGEEYETKLEIHEGAEILIEQEAKDWLKAYVYVDIAQPTDTKGESEKKESEGFKTGWLPSDKVGKI